MSAFDVELLTMSLSHSRVTTFSGTENSNSASGIPYFGLFGAKMWAHTVSKMAKKVIFMQATSLPNPVFPKREVLESHSLLGH